MLDSAAVSAPPRSGLVARAVAAVRRQPALSLTVALLWAMTLWPIWRPRFLPLLDLPNHLDAIAIWHRYSDPSWGYQRYYKLNLLPLPYWGYFFPVHLLSYLLPIELANKVYLSLYALLLPLGAMSLARRTGRSPWLALLVFPLVFNFNFQLGFITFCAGIALMLFAFSALDRFLEAPTRRGAIALFALTTFLYLTHVLPWLFFGVAALPWLFFHGWRPRRIAAAAGLMLPSVILGVLAFRASQDGTTHVQAGPLEYKAGYEPITAALEQVVHRLVATWPADRPFYFIVAFALAWLLLMASSRPDPDAAPRPGFAYRLEVLVVLAVLAALFLPMHLFKPVDLWMIGGRFVSVAAILLALLPRGPLVGRGSGWRALVLVPVVAIHVLYSAGLARQWLEFDRRVASFRRLARRIPRGSSTLTLVIGELSDPSVEYQAVPYVQFHAYAQLFGGGFDPWALNTGFPMVARPEARLPAPRWKQPHDFRFDAHGVYYDFVLIRSESFDHQAFGPDGAGRAPLVGHEGDWRLYQIRDPIPPPPPGHGMDSPEALSPAEPAPPAAPAP